MADAAQAQSRADTPPELPAPTKGRKTKAMKAAEEAEAAEARAQAEAAVVAAEKAADHVGAVSARVFLHVELLTFFHVEKDVSLLNRAKAEAGLAETSAEAAKAAERAAVTVGAIDVPHPNCFDIYMSLSD
eukprot:scaffold108274_cov13-Tisochrysis_lutea.AAC.1